jgi:hypothetical protein
MASRDHLRVAITDLLAPELLACDFVRTQPKTFARVRGDLVDGFSFQVSQWGSKVFYVHSWISPRCSPPNSGYLVGDRHDSDGIGAVDWVADTEERAQMAIASLRHYYLDKIEPWFQSIPDLSTFVQHYLKVHKRRRKSVEYLAMMLVLQRNDEYDSLIAEIDERKEEQSEELVRLRSARTEGTVDELINHWRAQNEEPLTKKAPAANAI